MGICEFSEQMDPTRISLFLKTLAIIEKPLVDGRTVAHVQFLTTSNAICVRVPLSAGKNHKYIIDDYLKSN